MNKIKIIDLLNKIANGEQPKTIKYHDDVYEFDCYEGEWGYVNKEYCRYKWFANEIDCDLKEQLNDEVKIIEENKKIEKMERHIPQSESELYCTAYNGVVDKINEIIDKLNKEE